MTRPINESGPFPDTIFIIPPKPDSVAFICDLKNLPIIEDSSFERIGKDVLSLSREHKITVYDASYIELALRKDLALASFDKEIIKVCKKIGVVVI